MHNKQPLLLKKRMRVMVDIEVTVSDATSSDREMNGVNWGQAQKSLLDALIHNRPALQTYLQAEAFGHLRAMEDCQWDRQPVDISEYEDLEAVLPSVAERLPDEIAQCFKYPNTDIWNWEGIDAFRDAFNSKVVGLRIEEVSKEGVNSSN